MLPVVEGRKAVGELPWTLHEQLFIVAISPAQRYLIHAENLGGIAKG